ncbi:MAG: glycosyltransferase, partial [Candidatus Eiseniibacteriota bacterium]
ALWSTYPIATAHRIGLTLQSLTGLPWVADFRDSMTEPHYPPNPRVRSAFRRIEERTVARASRVVFTTPGARRMYAERYPGLPASRWAVIPNGFEEGSFRDAEASASRPHPEGGPTVLVHSGLLYPSERDPRGFFAALGSLRRDGKISSSTIQVILRATGFDEDYRPMLRAEGIEDIVRLEPSIGYREALGEMLDADGLLLFQASNCNHQIPAKVYEYLRARRPIFAMTDPVGDTARVLVEAKIDTVVPLDSKAAIADGLVRFLEAVRRGSAPLASSEEIERHSRRARARELATLLDAVAKD